MEKINNGFKRTTIVKIIENKITKWIKSISDKELGKKVAESYMVTGGAITSLLLGEKPNDYDIYLTDKDVAVELANYYLKDYKTNDCVSRIEARKTDNGVKINIKSAGIIQGDKNPGDDYEYFELGGDISKYLDKNKLRKNLKSNEFKPIMITDNAISLSNDVQVILRFVGSPEEIHKNFDFVHTTNYYTPKTGLVLNPIALENILSKTLKYVGSLYPICSIFRIRKFINRGWTITAGEVLKICWDINNLNLKDMAVLQEQLIGVDSAYFYEVLNIIKKDSEKILDRTYLFSILNTVFDSELDEGFTESLLDE